MSVIRWNGSKRKGFTIPDIFVHNISLRFELRETKRGERDNGTPNK